MRNSQQKITCYSETQVEVSYSKESVEKWDCEDMFWAQLLGITSDWWLL